VIKNFGKSTYDDILCNESLARIDDNPENLDYLLTMDCFSDYIPRIFTNLANDGIHYCFRIMDYVFGKIENADNFLIRNIRYEGSYNLLRFVHDKKMIILFPFEDISYRYDKRFHKILFKIYKEGRIKIVDNYQFIRKFLEIVGRNNTGAIKIWLKNFSFEKFILETVKLSTCDKEIIDLVNKQLDIP
jgi:hypothetical protein